MASEVTLTKEEWEANESAEAAQDASTSAATAREGSTGGRTGTGANAGFAQQLSTTFDEKDEDDDVPNELPGEHRY